MSQQLLPRTSSRVNPVISSARWLKEVIRQLLLMVNTPSARWSKRDPGSRYMEISLDLKVATGGVLSLKIREAPISCPFSP